MSPPNVLLVMTDEERYPPPYEGAELAEFRRTQLPAHRHLQERGLELHRHYVGSVACLPSRATLFTGQYPSLHGVTDTNGLAKRTSDPSMHWLDPDTVPTLGDWFRAGGYQTHYRGKWHISHADLLVPGTHESLRVNDDAGVVDPEAVDAYRRADRLDPFGFSGWIGREPHGADKADTGMVRDGLFADQVVELFAELAAARSQGPWLAVASFVNPHDIAFAPLGWERAFGFGPPDDTVPEVVEAPSQADSFAGRPRCHEEFRDVWPKMVFSQPPDLAHRRLYYYLHKLVDRAVGRILEALDESGMAEDTVVVFTSDHGDLLGAHGGLLQKWYTGYDEALHVPFVVAGPGIAVREGGLQVPTSHVDVVPTLLGLAGIDREAARATAAVHHVETHELPGRDLSGLLTGSVEPETVREPLYFMTDDDISRGISQQNLISGESFEPVDEPSRVESVIASLPTAADGGEELWKLNHYYAHLADWYAERGRVDVVPAPESGDFWELHNLTADPEERRNVVEDETETAARLRGLLEVERDTKRLLPRHHNPSS